LPDAVALLVLAAGGWATFQSFWLWLWLSLELGSARGTNDAATLAPARDRMWRRCGRLSLAGLVALTLAVIELGGMRNLVEVMMAPGHRAIAAAISVTALGALVFAVGGMRKLMRSGVPMTHAEIEDDMGHVQLGLPGHAGVNFRHLGPARGASVVQELTITEMTRAWRSGEWRRDPDLFNFFIMTAGGLMAIYGGVGIVMAAGVLWVKALCAGFLAFFTFKLIAAVRGGYR
jgi:hypothetical protein